MTSNNCKNGEGLMQTTSILQKISRLILQHHPSLPNMKDNFKIKRMSGQNHLLMSQSNQDSSLENMIELKLFFQKIPTLSKNNL
jgi:hypothetical protein